MNMLPQGAQRRVEASARPDVGSLFVPTRVHVAPTVQHQTTAESSTTACRIAGVQRQPAFEEDLRLPGLLLPNQHAPVQAVPVAPVSPRSSTAKPKLRLSWAGSGIYFFWQLGAVQYLMNKFHLSNVPMVGASGGGLAAVLATCGVHPEEVLETAYALSLKHNIWERPAGLLGTWGGLIEQWLHDLLPADAAERCRDQVSIVVTQLPFCNQVSITDFKDKTDLVNVAMASAHVPIFLDWKVTRECRGVQCVDGSFPDFFTGENCDFLQCGGDAVVFDYFMDTNIVRNGRMDMLSLKEYREFKKMILLGYKFAQRLDEQGEFDRFDVNGVSKKLLL